MSNEIKWRMAFLRTSAAHLKPPRPGADPHHNLAHDNAHATSNQIGFINDGIDHAHDPRDQEIVNLTDELASLRVSVARIAQAIGVDNELDIRDDNFAALHEKATTHQRGWNDLAGVVCSILQASNVMVTLPDLHGQGSTH